MLLNRSRPGLLPNYGGFNWQLMVLTDLGAANSIGTGPLEGSLSKGREASVLRAAKGNECKGCTFYLQYPHSLQVAKGLKGGIIT